MKVMLFLMVLLFNDKTSLYFWILCGYPHDGRAHDSRADNTAYQHDCPADKQHYFKFICQTDR